MNPYEQVIEKLFSFVKCGREDLKVPETFSHELGHPERSFPSIHIAGTNGKGSVAHKIAKGLQSASLKVGLFTSPHLFSYRERIQINGEWISEEEVIQGIEPLFRFCEKQNIRPNFFELTTFLAFLFFREKKVDVAVIEVGIGGRLDTTNIIHPLLSVITSIGREHVEELGDTLEQIAEEKAGIIKPGIPVVLGPHARLFPLIHKAQRFNCPLFQVKETPAFFDDENSLIAKQALHILSKNLGLKMTDLEKGLSFRPSCRFEENGNVIFDVAHNPQGFSRLVQALQMRYPHCTYRFVVGMSADKEIESSLQFLTKISSHLHLAQANSTRAATTQMLEKCLMDLSFQHYSIEKSVGDAVQNAHSQLQNQQILIIAGSFYLMKEAKKAIYAKTGCQELAKP